MQYGQWDDLSHPLRGLNWITPPASNGSSPENGLNVDGRTHSSLSFPVAGDALSAQLESWASASFAFEDAFAANGLFDNNQEKDSGLGGAQQYPNPYHFGTAANVNTTTASELPPLEVFPEPYAFNAAAFESIVPSSAAVLPALNVVSPVESTSAVQAPAPKKKATAASKRKVAAIEDDVKEAVEAMKPRENMTEEELNALAIEEDKRRRNTAASARFRMKKKQREAALEESAKELKDRVALLERENDALRTENTWLRGLIVVKNGQGEEEINTNLKPERIQLAEESGPERE